MPPLLNHSARSFRPGRVLLASAICAGLLGGAVTSAHAADGGADGSASAPTAGPVVGSFAVAAGFEASIDERDGSVRFGLPVGGLDLAWDSRAASAGADEEGFGAGWGLGFARVSTLGGVVVHLPSGKSYDADAAQSSGLAQYGVGDVRFEQRTGVLPGREHDPEAGAPGRPADLAYAFVLHELGGTVSYYAESGELLTRISGVGERTDWVREAGGAGRLLAIVSPDGVVTKLDWTDPGFVEVTPAANLPGERDPVTGEPSPVPSWRIESAGGRVSTVTDPTGGRSTVGYHLGSDLVSGVAGPSGGHTQIEWQALLDQTVRVSRVRTVDADGVEVSVREWSPGADGTPSSGWPAFDGEQDWFRSGSSARYETEVTDGATRVVSEYNSQHRLVGRRLMVTGAGGERLLQEQALTYPGTEGGGVPNPEALPGNWSRPIATRITHLDANGGSRTQTESAEFDDLGRQLSATAADGTVTTTEYDREPPEGPEGPEAPEHPEDSPLPVGLPVTQTVTAPDGLVERTERELNSARTGVVATETWHGRLGAELTRVARSEFDLAEDGMVTAERVYPAGDPAAVPVATAWDRVVDLAAGTMTSTTTTAVGTPIEASTVEVTSLRHGGAIAQTDQVGSTSRAGFDALGRPRVRIDPAGNVATQTVETVQTDGRNATTTTTADGVAVTEIRDTIGRVRQILDNVDHGEAKPGFSRVVESRDYPDPATTIVTDAWGASTTTTQDLFGRETKTVGPTGLTKLIEHDDLAQQTTTGTSTTGDLAHAEQISTQTKDESGRVTSVSGRRQDGVPVPESRAGFDGLGRTTQTTDGTLDTSVEFDPYGNPTTTTLTPTQQVEGAVTAARRFDGFGVSLEKTLSDTDGASRSGGAQTLDAMGRTATETDQLGRVTSYRYTPDGLITHILAGSGQVTEHQYDLETRALVKATVTSPTGDTVTTAYEHDPVTGAVLAVFDPADRAGTEIRYEHDAHGHPLSVTYPDGQRIEYGYDAHGRRIRTTDIAGNVTTLTHTAEGLPVRAIQHDADGDQLGEVSYEHDEYGRLSTLTRGNGVVTAYSFTSASEIKTETTTDRDGVTLSARAYTYDPRGNLIERTDTTREGREADPATTVTSYAYDAFDRLTGSALRTGGQTTREVGYQHTVSGDIAAETVTETDAATGARNTSLREFEYSPLGELTAIITTAGAPGEETVTRIEAAYDEAGNLLRAVDGTEYSYDAANRPIQQTGHDGGTTEIGYWADGSRRNMVHTATSGADTTTRFYWDGSDLINDTHAGGPEPTATASYLIGASRHARSAPGGADGGTSWYGTDRHGNVTDLTDADGAVVERYAYSDYGQQRTSEPGDVAEARHGLFRNPFRYAGEYTDPGGAQYLRTRLYDADTMRFTTMDTAALHNLYAYADLNPITKVDPTGRAGEVDGWTIANAIMLGLGMLSMFTGVGSVLAMGRTAAAAAQLAEKSAWAVTKISVQIARPTVSDKLLAGLSTLLNGASSAVSATLLVDEHVTPVTDDQRLIDGLRWIELGAGGSGAFLAWHLAGKSTTRLFRLKVDANRHDAALDLQRRSFLEHQSKAMGAPPKSTSDSPLSTTTSSETYSPPVPSYSAIPTQPRKVGPFHQYPTSALVDSYSQAVTGLKARTYPDTPIWNTLSTLETKTGELRSAIANKNIEQVKQTYTAMDELMIGLPVPRFSADPNATNAKTLVLAYEEIGTRIANTAKHVRGAVTAKR